MQRNINEDIKVEVGIFPVAQTAGANTGTGVNVTETEEFAAVVQGSAPGDDGTLTFKLQESDVVGGTYTDITGAVMAAAITISSTDALGKTFIGRLRTSKLAAGNRFVRIVATVATNTLDIAGTILLGLSNKKPVLFSSDITEEFDAK